MARRGRGAGPRTVLLVCAVATLVACDTEAPTPTAAPAGRDVERWVLPLDEYMPPSPANYDYARNLLVQACLKEEGIEYAVAPVDITADGPETANRYGRRLFDEELARRYGYHPAPTDRFDRELAQRVADQRFPADVQALVDQCRQESYAELPQAPVSLAESLAFSLNVADEPELEAAIGRWQVCMSAAGYPDVATSPMDMPPPTLAESWGLNSRNPSVQDPSAEELAMAQADAACRSESGYSSRLYDAEWDRAFELARQHQVELDAEKAASAEMAETIRQIVARLGDAPQASR